MQSIKTPKKSGIYAILNTKTSLIYIGMTRGSISERFRQHREKLNSQKHINRLLQKAWNDYGREAFTFIVLENLPRNKSLKEYEAREAYWMEVFDSTNRQHGYNIRMGRIDFSDKQIQWILTSPLSTTRKAEILGVSIIKVAGIINTNTYNP